MAAGLAWRFSRCSPQALRPALSDGLPFFMYSFARLPAQSLLIAMFRCCPAVSAQDPSYLLTQIPNTAIRRPGFFSSFQEENLRGTP